MAKQYYVINDFSGGINNKKDPRDIEDNQLCAIDNMSIDALGKIKTIGKFYAHSKDQDGSTTLSQYIPEVVANLNGGGGYGLFYFESDHSNKPDETIILDETGGSALAIGTGNGNISFVKIDSTPAGSGRGDPELSLGE